MHTRVLNQTILAFFSVVASSQIYPLLCHR